MLRTSEELIETLEENQVQLQNMMTSKYIAFFYDEISTWQKRLSNVDQGGFQLEFGPKNLYISGLELARVPRVPGTRQNSEHHLWHPRILRFLILTGTRRAHSM